MAVPPPPVTPLNVVAQLHYHQLHGLWLLLLPWCRTLLFHPTNVDDQHNGNMATGLTEMSSSRRRVKPLLEVELQSFLSECRTNKPLLMNKQKPTAGWRLPKRRG